MKNKKEKPKTNIKVKVVDIRTKKEFFRYFETEFEKTKYLRRLKYFKNIRLVNSYKNDWED